MNKIVNHHGIHNLEAKSKELLIDRTNINEINKLFKYFDVIEKYISSNNLKWKIFIPTLPHLKNAISNKILKSVKNKMFIVFFIVYN